MVTVGAGVGTGVDVCANVVCEEIITSAEKTNAKVFAEMASAKKFIFDIFDEGSDPTPRRLCTVLFYQSKGGEIMTKVLVFLY